MKYKLELITTFQNTTVKTTLISITYCEFLNGFKVKSNKEGKPMSKLIKEGILGSEVVGTAKNILF